jgi:hypothetical protein
VRDATVATVAAIAALYLAVVTFVFPAANPAKSARPLAVAMREASASSRAAGERVAAYRLSNLPEALAFYSGVYTLELQSLPPLVQHLERPGEVFALFEERVLGELPASLRERLTVVARQERSRSTVVLVTNRASAARPGP